MFQTSLAVNTVRIQLLKGFACVFEEVEDENLRTHWFLPRPRGELENFKTVIMRSRRLESMTFEGWDGGVQPTCFGFKKRLAFYPVGRWTDRKGVSVTTIPTILAFSCTSNHSLSHKSKSLIFSSLFDCKGKLPVVATTVLGPVPCLGWHFEFSRYSNLTEIDVSTKWIWRKKRWVKLYMRLWWFGISSSLNVFIIQNLFLHILSCLLNLLHPRSALRILRRISRFLSNL